MEPPAVPSVLQEGKAKQIKTKVMFLSLAFLNLENDSAILKFLFPQKKNFSKLLKIQKSYELCDYNKLDYN